MENMKSSSVRGKAINNDPRLLGKRYCRLKIVGFKKTPREWLWEMECDCGKIKILKPCEVKSGRIKSCGCLHNEVAKERASKHAYPIYQNKRLYNIYNHMKNRCTKPKSKRFKDYGGRGIRVCDEWAKSFDTFVEWAYATGYNDALTLERVDVNGDYSPENCCWIPLIEQAKNKRDTVYVEYKGSKVRLIDLANESAVSYDTLHNRIRSGWDIERAVTEASASERKSLCEICREKGLKYETVLNRINRLGWTREKALSVPVRRK